MISRIFVSAYSYPAFSLVSLILEHWSTLSYHKLTFQTLATIAELTGDSLEEDAATRVRFVIMY